MSFFRKLTLAVAVMGLATAVFADDNVAANATNPAAANSAAASSDTAAVQPMQVSSADMSSTSQATDAKINLNTATVKDLMHIKGLNAAKAKSIVAYRKKHGNFTSVDQLKEVKGFKKMDEKTMKYIADQLTIG